MTGKLRDSLSHPRDQQAMIKQGKRDQRNMPIQKRDGGQQAVVPGAGIVRAPALALEVPAALVLASGRFSLVYCPHLTRMSENMSSLRAILGLLWFLWKKTILGRFIRDQLPFAD